MPADIQQDSPPPAGIDSAAAANGSVHMIWTRDVDVAGAFGRLNMARATRAALSERLLVSEGRLRSLLELRSPAAALRALGAYLAAGLRGRALPLQCLLFADPAEARRVVAAIPAGTATVYVDGVRSLAVLRRVRRDRPDLGVVTDLDDLMSRRMRLLLALGQTPSTGYLKRQMPRWLDAIIGSPALARGLLRYEAATLGRIERDVVGMSDACVLVSAEDARVLGGAVADDAGVVGIAPPARIVRAPAPLAPGPLRFVFIGSDALRQNQLTIDRLLDWWGDHAIETPLAIYGEQARRPALPPGVTMPGFARTIDEVYDGRSILLSPSYLAGGIKTKVLEAFGRGAPVIGNAVTFEGMSIGAYPLLFDDENAMIALLRAPDGARDRLDAGAAHGAAMVRRHHDPAQFAARWLATVDGAATAARARRQPAA